MMTYNGGFVSRERNGFGKAEFANGDVYEGKWRRGLMEKGYKTYRYAKYGKEGFIYSRCLVEYDPETDWAAGIRRWQ